MMLKNDRTPLQLIGFRNPGFRLFALGLLSAVLVLTLIPSAAFAKTVVSSWDELKVYSEKQLGDKQDSNYDEAKKQYGRELTPEEVETWKKCIDAQKVYNETWAKGKEPTEKQLSTMAAAGEAVFGTPEEILAIFEKSYSEENARPVDIDSTDLLSKVPNISDKSIEQDLPVETKTPSAWDYKIVDGVLMPTDTSQDGITTNIFPALPLKWYIGGDYTTPIGTYPTQKGKILATADYAFNLIPTGHAAIVIDATYVVESLAEGVIIGTNNWNDTSKSNKSFKRTCFGLDVIATTIAQEEKVASWCAAKLGLPYNFDLTNPDKTDSYYCSQLIWQGFKNKYGVDLNTSEFGKAVHPLELVKTSQTQLLYRHGSALANRWENINGRSYFINSSGYPLAGGWRYTDSTNGWKYFAPTGECVGTFQVAIGSAINSNKRMDIPNGSKEWGIGVQIWDAWPTSDIQRWDVFTVDGTNWYIQNRKTELYLETYYGYSYNGAPVIQCGYTGSNAQKWRLVSLGGDKYAFKHAVNTSRALDLTDWNTANGTKLQLWDYHGGNNQIWRFLDKW